MGRPEPDRRALLPLVLPLFLSLLWGSVAGATERRDLPWSGGDDVPLTAYPASGDRLVLMLPGERGVSPRQAPIADGLALRGVETWSVDLHGALFLAPGPRSLGDVPAGLVAELIEHGAATGKRVYLMASGRGAALALEGARRWQLDHPSGTGLGGAVLFHPNLYRRTPQGGTDPEYLPIAGATNLALYLFQPMASSGRWYVTDLTERLQNGGSDVLVHRLPGVGDGFHLRSDFDAVEAETSERLPDLVSHALNLLEAYGRARDAAPLPSEAGAEAGPGVKGAGTGLLPFTGAPAAPPLRLRDLQGVHFDLDDYSGRVVLVNFWATWCPPCVKEIPSMQRLVERLGHEEFTVLTVDVGEEPATVRKFMARFSVDFPVLMDPDGVAVRRWQVHAYPTSFLIDRAGAIRFSLFGALEWDAPDVVARVEGLLRER